MSILWYRSNNGSFYGVLSTDGVNPDRGHTFVNGFPVNRDTVVQGLGEEWVRRKEESIERYGLDIERGERYWADITTYALAMGAAQRAVAREHTLRRNEETLEINMPEDEEEEKPKRWQELNTEEIPERDKPRFWIPYQSHEEIHMRLHNSIILVKSRPFLVHRAEERNDKEYLLYLLDSKNGRYTIPYSHEGVDLRSPDPGYGVKDGAVSYLVRRPERVQRQGMCTENTLRKVTGKKTWSGLPSNQEILHHLYSRKTRPLSKAILETMEEGLLNHVLLSPKVAVFNTNKGLTAEYKGRVLGRVLDHTVRLSPEDASMSHIKKDLQEVHLEA